MHVTNKLGPIEAKYDNQEFSVIWYSNDTVGISIGRHVFTGYSIEVRKGEIWLKNDDNSAIWFCCIENHLLRRIEVENNRKVD